MNNLHTIILEDVYAIRLSLFKEGKLIESKILELYLSCDLEIGREAATLVFKKGDYPDFKINDKVKLKVRYNSNFDYTLFDLKVVKVSYESELVKYFFQNSFETLKETFTKSYNDTNLKSIILDSISELKLECAFIGDGFDKVSIVNYSFKDKSFQSILNELSMIAKRSCNLNFTYYFDKHDRLVFVKEGELGGDSFEIMTDSEVLKGILKTALIPPKPGDFVKVNGQDGRKVLKCDIHYKMKGKSWSSLTFDEEVSLETFLKNIDGKILKNNSMPILCKVLNVYKNLLDIKSLNPFTMKEEEGEIFEGIKIPLNLENLSLEVGDVVIVSFLEGIRSLPYVQGIYSKNSLTASKLDTVSLLKHVVNYVSLSMNCLREEIKKLSGEANLGYEQSLNELEEIRKMLN